VAIRHWHDLCALGRLILPIPKAPFSGAEGTVDEGFADIKTASRPTIAGRASESHALPPTEPLLKASMTVLMGR
jgi:hypothetical protein